MPDSFNVHIEWKTHYKRAMLRQEAGDEFDAVEKGLWWLWGWATCYLGAERRGDGFIGDDWRQIAHHAEWPIEEATVERRLRYLETCGLIERLDDGWQIHELEEYQPHLRAANASRQNGKKGGRPPKAAPVAEKKPRETQGNLEPPGQDRTGQDKTGQEIPPTPRRGERPKRAPSERPEDSIEVRAFVELWNPIARKHKLAQIALPVAPGVAKTLRRGLRRDVVAPYWRKALELIDRQGFAPWVVERNLGWDWLLRVRSGGDGPPTCLAIVEKGFGLRRPGEPKGRDVIPGESPVERLRRKRREAPAEAEAYWDEQERLGKVPRAIPGTENVFALPPMPTGTHGGRDDG